jgi:predicted enzyme related to lactoylglutathione lyase
MSQITTHAPGTSAGWSWAPPTQTPRRRFYAGLFAWEPKDTPAGDAGTYTLLMLRGREVGGLSNMQKEQLAQGVPPHWLPYMSVAGADETTKKATALGGHGPRGTVRRHGARPHERDPGSDRRGVRDLAGEVASRRRRCATNRARSRGASCSRTMPPRPGRSTPGCSAGRSRTCPCRALKYTVFTRGDDQVGGMMTIMKEWGPMPSNWLTYFAVADCERHRRTRRRSWAAPS